MPTMPLKRAIYFAPFIPKELLRITEKGRPYFCDGFPIRLAKKQTSVEAISEPNKTTKTFNS